VAVRLRDIVFAPVTLPAGGVLRMEVTVENIGTALLTAQDNRPPGYTYTEGEVSPPGVTGLWRIGVDQAAIAGTQMHRYRWGFGGALAPGASRRVIGYIRLNTPGVYHYCVGIVQEFVSWRATCEGLQTITVQAPVVATATPSPTLVSFATPTRTPTTTCADSYEVDNTYQQARVIGANSSLAQQRNFHQFGDIDWVKFAVIPNIPYTIRTLDVHGGADTMITLFGNDGGVLYQLAQNDEDVNNPSVPVVGPSRIDYTFTTTDTARFGTTFYLRINSPNPANFGCDRTYALRVTYPTTMSPGGLSVASLASDLSQSAWTAGDGDLNRATAPSSTAAPVADAPRVSFTLILELRGGGP